MTNADRPRVLFIDAYDSFSNNIISLLETSLNVEVSSIKIDTPLRDLASFLNEYDAVVAGPGPGDPRTAKDVGLFQRLWALEGAEVIPVLGICLGFQSLVLAYGGGIERLPEPRHGLVRSIISDGDSIFRHIPSLKAVQYHSLHATLNAQSRVTKRKPRGDQPNEVAFNVYLTPLAWDHELENDALQTEQLGSRNPHSILMAVKHNKKPFYGIQFHPESICSSLEARKIIKNWWDEVCIWRARRCKLLTPSTNGISEPHYVREKQKGPPISHLDDSKVPQLEQESHRSVISHVVKQAGLTLPGICETVGAVQGNSIIFDSEKHSSTETASFSIISIIEESSLRFEYKIGRPGVLQICLGKVTPINLDKFGNDVFTYLGVFMQNHRANNGNPSIPFWGGLMGYTSYETCLETLGIKDSVVSDFSQTRPDLCFVFVERSIVIDHVHKAVHIQSLKPGDHAWVNSIASLLSVPSSSMPDCSLRTLPDLAITYPNEKRYKTRIRTCQAEIRAGNSYELCLTNQASITTHSKIPSWPMYCRLRNVNPAPFGAYVQVGDLTILSSSPERFMQWSRPTVVPYDEKQPRSKETSVLQFRPIKGTITRRPTPDSPPRSLREATRLLSTQKERAENLMIVDLIRHDLHGVVGSGRVSVPKLMVVEEYETVFQLVSVIEGAMIVDAPQKPAKEGHKDMKGAPADSAEHINRFDNSRTDKVDGQTLLPESQNNAGTKSSSPLAALPATLPPGSMTGAPKLRSCQILHSLEAQPRGVYSGIIGYIDVGGGGDWSVAIRCAVRWDDPNAAGDHWTVGAGGAVTALSTEQGEWEEMLAKLQATLRIFQDS